MATETTTTPRTAGEWLFYIFAPPCPDPCAGCPAERETSDCDECPVEVERQARRWAGV